MIEFDEYKVKLSNIRPKLDALADSLGIEAAKEEIDRLHAQIDSEGFWDNQEISQKVMKQSRTLEAKVARSVYALRNGAGGQRRLHAP